MEDVVQLVEITNNVQTAPAPPTPTAAAPEPQVASTPVNDVPVEVEPLSDSGEGVDALIAPTAANADADSDAAGEPLVTVTIPTALVAEGTEVSLSLQDSFKVQGSSATDVAATSDPATGFSSATPETTGETGANSTTESPTSNAVDAAATESTEADAADPGSNDVAAADSAATESTEADAADPGSNDATAADSEDAATEDSAAGEESDGDADDNTADETEPETEDNSGEDEASSDESSDEGRQSDDENKNLRVNAKKLSKDEVLRNLSDGDKKATQRAVKNLNLPDLSGLKTPTPEALGRSLLLIRSKIRN